MTKSNVDRLGRRMVELNNALQDKRTNPEFVFESVKSVDMLIKFIIYLNDADENISDGLYVYLNDKGEIVNAEYFVKEDDDVTIISFTDEQIELIVELFSDVFTVNVD